MDKIRILLADDQDIIRHGLKLIIDQQADMEVVGQAGDGEAAVALAKQLQPDIVLMDIKMPKMNGIQATRLITGELPKTRVIILTTYDVDGWVFDGIRAGAQGYLLKDTTSDQLQVVIRSVHAGESQIDPAVAGKVMEEFRRLSARANPVVSEPQPKPAAHSSQQGEGVIEQLTEREMDVLLLIAEGLSNKEIAGRLFLSEGTVRNYVSVIMGKLHANDRTQVLIKASRRKIIRLE
jgi:DNA-binding NarL/FixJ family response regulator